MAPMLHTLRDLERFYGALPASPRMPVLFVGHGSPMNGIEDNDFSRAWQALGERLPPPSAILCISAHWLTQGVYVTAMDAPRTIHDFGGFPQELHEVQYPAPGHAALAREVAETIATYTATGLDHEWGLDHGAWTVLRRMFPEARIPVLQMSIDYRRPARWHYELGQQLDRLRDKGVLIVGSGNMVHNLRMVAWDKLREPFGYDWALDINQQFKQHIAAGAHAPLIDYEKLGTAARLAVPTPDHYYPMLYALALSGKPENLSFFNDAPVGGSLTMTSFIQA